ncbi:redoxin domain-containing protein [Luteolibacter marinus]|uniref:redoxin domain-containing protein n=1 Tax=Luteolibacter marinus TaxID=2776705 RepID=UPI001868617E|nr:redoxin domain-containing protein [Luteolibacter marinus]
MKNNTFLGAVLGAMICSATAYAVEPGDAAPAFTVKNVKGEEVSLSDYKDKVVVLEWINHSCPFVQKHYGSGNMQKLQETYTGKDVVWISVNSSAEGQQGYLPGEELAAKSAKEGSKASQIVIDSDGKVGHAYDAKTTPHMIVIGKDGKVAYNGAIDSKASVDAADIASSDNYVAAALDAVLAGQTVETAKTKPYGCGVKYAK